MTAATATAPSLSQIQAWRTSHLEHAATQWAQTARIWECAFTDVHREALAPGGTTWLGAAAEAAALRTGLDRGSVVRSADQLHAAAAAARFGVDDIAAARRLALQAINGARAAGFDVTEGLSVIDRQIGGSSAQQIVREVEAQAHASTIRMRAEMLVAVDAEVAGKLAAATDGLDRIEFSDTAIAPREKPVIQAIHYAPIPDTPIKDPGVPDDPVGIGRGPTGAEIWSVIDKLPRGNRPWIREIRSVEDLQRLWDWMKQNASTISDPYDATGKGIEFHLTDGSRIGQRLRAKSTLKPAVDINIGDGFLKVHVNPRGGVPEIPSAPALRSEQPPNVKPTKSPSVRSGGAPGRLFGGGVLPDNALPHFIEPPQTKDSPVIGDGIPDAER